MIKITLAKQSATGKPLIWEGSVEGNVITVIHGQVGGKLQTKVTTITEGKNIGRSNETTPAQQALSELETTARGKTEKDYVITNGYKFTTVKENQVKIQNKEIPAPMLAHPFEKHLKKIENRNVAYQVKIDGFRAVYSKEEGKFYSRSRKELIGCPEIVESLQSLNLTGIDFLDGELYAPSETFETISSIVSPKKTMAEKFLRDKIEYHVFDYINNDETFRQRSAVVDQLRLLIKAKKITNVKIVETKFIQVESLEKTLRPIVEACINEGWEGIMIRIPESTYENKRSHGIFKYKLFEDCEAKCIGFKAEENRPDLLGSISFELSDGKTFDARPAMTESQRAEIFKNQTKYLGRQGVVKYQEKSQYGIPRFPVFTGKWRESWDI